MVRQHGVLTIELQTWYNLTQHSHSLLPCRGDLPSSMTGRHVEAGHKGIKHTPDFGKQTPRPGSAPPLHPEVHTTPVSEAEAQVCENGQAFASFNGQAFTYFPDLIFLISKAKGSRFMVVAKAVYEEKGAREEGGC